MENNLNGVINIYKEAGYTSHDVVAIVKKTIRQKTGHTGTLDPEAVGVLPVCIGKATKLSDYIAAQNKQYICECVLGKATDTQDFTGKPVFEKKPDSTGQEITDAVMSFIGEYEQTPPMYSAVKINGKKLYELAREGKEIERKAKRVIIEKIDILEINPPNTVTFSVDCGKGTYIRTLCHDIGLKLGCGAYMKSLVRSRSGNFTLDTAVKIDNFKEMYQKDEISGIIISLEQITSVYKQVIVNNNSKTRLLNGNPIGFENLTYDCMFENGEILSIYDEDKLLIGLYKPDFTNDVIKPAVMLI